ncbi:MAG: ubiquitin-like protein [Gemmatimonadota bacterium]|nr:ubiquitin-like protein [Gemmatimonadota bacterium]
MPFLTPRTHSVPSPSKSLTSGVAGGVRDVVASIARCSRRLTLLLPFVALALCPEEASAQIQIFTRNLTPLGAPTVTLDVDENNLIEQVKAQHQGKFGYLAPNQYLFFAGKLLKDGRTLTDYNIQRESIIDMAVIDSFNGLSFSGFLPGSRGGFSPFLMRSGTSGAGNGWSVFNYTNAVDLSATGSGTYTLNLFTILPAVPDVRPDELGPMPDFDGHRAYDWTFLTATGGISGFAADQFVINSGNFANPVYGSFAVVQQGNSLALSYTPVPEPSTWVLVMTGLAFGGWRMSRRRQRA